MRGCRAWASMAHASIHPATDDGPPSLFVCLLVGVQCLRCPRAPLRPVSRHHTTPHPSTQRQDTTRHDWQQTPLWRPVRRMPGFWTTSLTAAGLRRAISTDRCETLMPSNTRPLPHENPMTMGERERDRAAPLTIIGFEHQHPFRQPRSGHFLIPGLPNKPGNLPVQ